MPSRSLQSPTMTAPAPAPNQGLKTNYRCVPYLQQFYSGNAFAISSDGSFLACACNGAIKLVEVSDASVRATLEGDSESVTALVIGPDDRFLFSASHSRLIHVWDLSTFKCIRSWKGHDGPVMGMVCHASGGLLATAGVDNKVRVWDVDGGFCTHFFRGHEGVVTSIMFHTDRNQLLLKAIRESRKYAITGAVIGAAHLGGFPLNIPKVHMIKRPQAKAYFAKAFEDMYVELSTSDLQRPQQ